MRIAIALLLMTVLVQAETKLTIIPITADHFSGAVQFPVDARGDQAIVRVFYWADRTINGQSVHLLLSKEFVIPVLPSVSVAFDETPAAIQQIRNIEVTIVSNVGTQNIQGAAIRKDKP